MSTGLSLPRVRWRDVRTPHAESARAHDRAPQAPAPTGGRAFRREDRRESGRDFPCQRPAELDGADANWIAEATRSGDARQAEIRIVPPLRERDPGSFRRQQCFWLQAGSPRVAPDLVWAQAQPCEEFPFAIRVFWTLGRGTGRALTIIHHLMELSQPPQLRAIRAAFRSVLGMSETAWAPGGASPRGAGCRNRRLFGSIPPERLTDRNQSGSVWVKIHWRRRMHPMGDAAVRMQRSARVLCPNIISTCAMANGRPTLSADICQVSRRHACMPRQWPPLCRSQPRATPRQEW